MLKYLKLLSLVLLGAFRSDALLDQKVAPNITDILKAILKGRVIPDFVDGKDRPPLLTELGTHTLFCAAVAGRQYDVVHKLLLRGVVPDFVDARGRTPLLTAVEVGDVLMVKLLLEKGANPNAQASNGTTPLSAALMRNNNSLMIELLLEGGANKECNATTPPSNEIRAASLNTDESWNNQGEGRSRAA
jgi:ankyrin repeat protein